MPSELNIADYVKAIKPHSDPRKIDSDDDDINDDEEEYLGTLLMNADTDGDTLSDGYEVDLWYDPTNANPDNDKYNDAEELENDTSPFVYNMDAKEQAEAFASGSGNGYYPVYFGYDVKGSICSIIVEFVETY